jgi:FMN phosphatase YigB (HAD superfamily)
MSSPPRALVFDLGNVLVFHDNALLFLRLAERAQLSAEEAERRLTGPLWEQANRGQVDGAGIRRGVCALLGMDIPEQEFFELWSCHFQLNHSLFPHLEALAPQVPLLLLSNTNVLHFEWLRQRLPVLGRFSHLLLSYELGWVKPERAIYEEALKRAGTHPQETLFFDDIPQFVEASRQVGIRGHVFTGTGAFVALMRQEMPQARLATDT